MSDAGKYVAGGIIGAAVVGLIALAVHNRKKAEWDKEKELMQYEIHTLEGEVLSQRDYIGRLENRITDLEDFQSRQSNSITGEVKVLVSEVEGIRNQVSRESEFYGQLTSIIGRLNNLKELATYRQAVPAFR